MPDEQPLVLAVPVAAVNRELGDSVTPYANVFVDTDQTGGDIPGGDGTNARHVRNAPDVRNLIF